VEGREVAVNLAFLKKSLVPYIVIFSCVAFISLAWLSFGRHGLIDLYKMKKEREKCLAILNNLKEKNRILADEIRRLKEDNKYFESVAREQLGMVRDNEIVYRFKNKLENDRKENKKKK
jgi:cell division protein FtsB